MDVDGILFLYHHRLRADAGTIMEHVDAFERYSGYTVFKLNTQLGFPQGLAGLRFKAVVLHYSLFGNAPFQLNDAFQSYLKQTDSYKVAFFQDEHVHCQARFAFINEQQLACVFTLVDPQHWPDVYQRFTQVPRLEHNLTGYVPQELAAFARQFVRPNAKRGLDLGYRARDLPFEWGRGGQEKAGIARAVKPRAEALGLVVDIETAEDKRIYGPKWHAFVADCKGMLGVEAGVSIFDVEGTIRPAVAKFLAENPGISFDEAESQFLGQFEDKIFYRTISPRHFEAAAFRTCQILYEGRYNDLLIPHVHYIPLAKDMSNFDEVMRVFMDEAARAKIVDAAYNDLIASGRYTYERFVKDRFDPVMADAGLKGPVAAAEAKAVWQLLKADAWQRGLPAYSKEYMRRPFPGRAKVVKALKPLLVLHPGLKRLLEP